MEVPEKPSWEDVEIWIIELAKQIGDFKPDSVIGISRGGWIPAVLLSRITGGYSLIPIDIERVGKERKVRGLFALPSSMLAGKKVLLVEDIVETGKSLIVAKEFLEQNGATVKTVCIFTRDFSEIDPDFVIAKGLTYEVLFPWERLKEKFKSTL